MSNLVRLYPLFQPFKNRTENGIEKTEHGFVISGEPVFVWQKFGVQEQSGNEHVDE
ncbi:MAG: hypothetical protein O9353_06255 [Bacteroidia bacterium]|nr:hypothetical protein [Bacteroidia bacterium]